MSLNTIADLDIIVPVFNGQNSIEELVLRIKSALNHAHISYKIIFVDDRSSDNTISEIKRVASQSNGLTVIYDSKNYVKDSKDITIENSNIVLVHKTGPQGKGYSILEGARVGNAPLVAFIDSDLQYPPEAIPQMYHLAKKWGICVANRKTNSVESTRKFASYLNKILLEKLLLGFNCDTQSGLKIFKRNILKYINGEAATPWTFDMYILRMAKELGYQIGSYDVEFTKRKSPESKVDFLKTNVEIISSATKLKMKRNSPVFPIKPTNNPYLGSGLYYRGKKFVTHSNLDLKLSALKTFQTWQKVTLVTLFVSFLSGLLLNLTLTLTIAVSVLTVIYLLDLLLTLFLTYKSLHFPPEVKFNDAELKNIKDEELPTYTILCPLYKEDNVLPYFVEALNALDWPEEKKEVLLLLEKDDEKTIQKAKKLHLGANFKILVVPHTLPKTKPKACNYGLAYAKGKYLVIYDAEDRPEPLQLKKAYVAFKKLSPNVVCLQSKLNYYNSDQNLLTKLFTAEYSLWFDIVLPGLQSIQTSIPLGGTSNHFKTHALRFLNGWDSFNVTEDCDLGARLYKEGFQTAIIDSTTLEEANSNIKSWIKQRSRWIKGYMQTFLVHTRDPYGFFKRHGIHALIFQLVVGMRMTFMIVNPFLWFATVLYFTHRSTVGAFLESIYITPIYYLAVISLVFGNFVYFYNYMIGLAKRHQWSLIKYVYLIPFYWIMASAAACVAFYQLLIKPYYWEKTKHGLHLYDRNRGVFADIRITIDFDTAFRIPGFQSITKIIAFSFQSIRNNLLDLIDLLAPLPEPGNANNGNLNILIFNWRDTKHVFAGGAEVYLHEIAKQLVKLGHNVTIFASWDGRGERTDNIDNINIIRRGGFITVYPFAAIYYLFRLRGKYDVIIDSENGIPFFTPFFSNIPKILLIHHVHQEVFRKHLQFPLSQIASFLEANLMPAVYKYSTFLTISESSKQDILGNSWANGKGIEIVHPGVDHTVFQRFPKTQNPSFVYLGRLKGYKNVDCAIEAFKNIHDEFPEATLTIAGGGEEETFLKGIVKDLDLEHSVIFTGRVSNQERNKILSQSWVAIQPSSFEGWGITVIEAGASGTPTVASNVKGLRDSVIDGETGILYPVRDVEKLTLALKKIIIDSRFREYLSLNAYQWSKNFSWSQSAVQFENILKKEVRFYQYPKGTYDIAEVESQ